MRGQRWTVEAGGTPERYYTFMHIELPDGRETGGGMGGPTLWPDRLVNCSVHWSLDFRIFAVCRVPVL
jgi:hypothetical protein